MFQFQEVWIMSWSKAVLENEKGWKNPIPALIVLSTPQTGGEGRQKSGELWPLENKLIKKRQQNSKELVL